MKIEFNEKEVRAFYFLLNHKYLTELRFLKRGYFPAFSIVKNANKISIFVGPEGGWAKEEIELARRKNFEIVNLGKLNLRSETAAIVGSFLAINFSKNEFFRKNKKRN